MSSIICPVNIGPISKNNDRHNPMPLRQHVPFCLYGVSLSLFLAPIAVAQDDAFIVTGVRHGEAWQDYAGSIEDFDTDEDTILISHPSQLLNQAAGINIQHGSGQEHLTAIRSPVLTGGAGAGSFLYTENGIPIRAAGFANVNGLFESILDISDSVDVVKGPASVRYGSNAVHGLINIMTDTPRDTSTQLGFTASNQGFLKARLARDTVRESGFTRIRTQLTHNDDVRADAGYDQQKLLLQHGQELGPWTMTASLAFDNFNQETAGFIFGTEAYKDNDLIRTNDFPEAFRDSRSLRGSAAFERPLASNATVTLTPFFRSTDMQFLRHFVPGQALEKNGHKSLGLQATYFCQTNKLNYTLGFDGDITSGYVKEFQNNPTRFSFVQGEHYDYDVSTNMLAAYGRMDYALSPKTTARISARLDHTHFDYNNQTSPGQSGRFLRIDDRTDSYTILTPKLSLHHHLSPALTAYVRVARGARAPQISDLYSLQSNQAPGEIKAETLDALEGGLKYQTNKLQASLDLFAMKKDGFFFRNANGFNVVNGKTDHMGLEGSVVWTLSDRLTLRSAVTYAEHTYSFSDAASGIVDGNQVDTAPKWVGSSTLTYSPFSNTDFTLRWDHMGDYFTDPSNVHKYAGHDILALTARHALSGSTDLSVQINNLFDTRYATRADFAFGRDRYFPGQERHILFSLGVKY